MSNWTWQYVGEGRACIYNTVLKSRQCWVDTRSRLRFFFLNSCFPMIYFSQWFFFMLTFSLYLCLCISAASWNPASCLFACLLATSKMLEWGLGWLLCWWQMKEKQTQLACLQLQWFSRAGSSEDMLFVDKTHDSKVWGEAEVDSISVWSCACHACMKSQLIVLT